MNNQNGWSAASLWKRVIPALVLALVSLASHAQAAIEAV